MNYICLCRTTLPVPLMYWYLAPIIHCVGRESERKIPQQAFERTLVVSMCVKYVCVYCLFSIHFTGHMAHGTWQIDMWTTILNVNSLNRLILKQWTYRHIQFIYVKNIWTMKRKSTACRTFFNLILGQIWTQRPLTSLNRSRRAFRRQLKEWSCFSLTLFLSFVLCTC